MTEQVLKIFNPDIDAIRLHIEFVVRGMSDYSDGKIEIAYGDSKNIPRNAETFAADEAEKAALFAAEKNAQGRNVYLVGSVLDPDMAPFGRSSDADFYASNVVWCDIDKEVSPEELRQRYAALPPSLVVVTGRTPHIRTHLWWKLAEAVTDSDTLREALEGLQQVMGGDPAVKNVTSLMRLGGTIAWPTKNGRVTERTEVITPSNATQQTTIERILQSYPCNNFYHNDTPTIQPEQSYSYQNIIEAKIADGRDKYMSDMVYASIVNLAAELNRWPTPQEVMDDAWPTYERKVTPRNGRTLDQDGRGQKHMVSKIKSKLSAFQRGKMRGLETPGQCKPRNKPLERVSAPIVLDHDESTGEIKEAPRSGLIPYTWAYDIKPSIDANDFVEGLLGQGQFSVIYGESNCGKTFFMTDLAFHVATGKKWRDRRVEQGGVVYVALEGSYGLSNRIAAYMQEFPEDSLGMPLAVITTQINFLDPNGNLGIFIDTIRQVAEEVGNVKLVVIDTLARAISGGDENSGQDMGLLVAHADLIRQATGAHVSFVHHSGKNKALGARGHSSLRAAVDTELEVSREEEAQYSTVKIVKQRDMESGDEMYFGLKAVCIGVNRYNEEVKSCVVTVVDEPEQSVKRDARLTDTQQFVYDAILNCMITHGTERVITDMGRVKCVTYDMLAKQLESMGWPEIVDENKSKIVTKNARVALRNKGKIGFNDGWIWVVKDAD